LALVLRADGQQDARMLGSARGGGTMHRSYGRLRMIR
jgi:hypothetical protein